jgi:hypothetical protein
MLIGHLYFFWWCLYSRCSLPIFLKVLHFFFLICKSTYLYDINVLFFMYIEKLEGIQHSSFSNFYGEIKWKKENIKLST